TRNGRDHGPLLSKGKRSWSAGKQSAAVALGTRGLLDGRRAALAARPLSARRPSLSSAPARGTELAPVRWLRHPESLFFDRKSSCPATGEQRGRSPPAQEA